MRATVTHVRSRGKALSMCGRLTYPERSFRSASVPQRLSCGTRTLNFSA